MKKFLALTSLAIVFGYFGVVEAAAQELNAKDMYTESNGNGAAGGNTRYQGAKVTVLLKRGNQRERNVSINETFYSGDKIKLVFDINFSGYAAIVNTGPSGNRTILFPYADRYNRMVSHRVTPNAGTQLPRGSDWIVFHGETGREQITVIFSKNPIPGLDAYEANNTTSSSDARIAEGPERDRILNILNSKSLLGGNSKDLVTQTDAEGTYGVVRNGLGSQPAMFTFYLKHQ